MTTEANKRKVLLIHERRTHDPITRHRLGEFPPCFESFESYRRWISLNKQAPTPARKVFQREPNYCADCTPAFQSASIKRRVCLFPATEFHERMEASIPNLPHELQEALAPTKEVIGYEKPESRNKRRGRSARS
jgi:hypothetical protein